MARKKNAKKKNSGSSAAAPAWRPAKPRVILTAAAALLAVLFFMLTSLGNPASIKGCAMAADVTAIAVAALRFRQLRKRITLPFIALFLVVLAGGVSTLYAVAPKFALGEFLQMLIAFDAALLLTVLAPADGTADSPAPDARRIASVVEGSGALLAVINIDLLSTRWVSGLFLGLLSPFTSFFQEVDGVEPGVRLFSMFGSPNVFAGLMGVLILLSLGLIASAPRSAERMYHIACLAAESLAFVLAFSMGAAFMLALAFLLYLLLERKERRGPQLILMTETLLIILVMAAIAAPSALRTWDGFRPVPLLCLAGGAALLILADRFIGIRLEEKLAGRDRLAAGCLAGIVALAVLFAFAAVRITGSVSLQAGEALERAVYPEPGEYTLRIDADQPLQITVSSQNEAETVMHTRTQLYTGEENEAVFTVPEDSRVVYIQFSSEQGGTIRSAEYAGRGGSAQVPLDYRLLPDYMANRIQGLRNNENAVQRLVFFRDGMKLFARSPVIGLGLGGFENGIKSVQSFYYETKYAHNHYIQTMVDTGLLGLALFLFLLAVSAAAVLRDRFGRNRAGMEQADAVRGPGGHTLTPALGAALFMMAAHAAVDVDFSHYCFLPTAYCVFALIGLCSGDALPAGLPFTRPSDGSGTVRTAAVCVILAFLLAWIGLLGMNLRAAGMVRKDLNYDTLAKAAAMDRFERSDYLISYIYYASTQGADETVMEQADRYAEQLKQVDSNAIPLYLAGYYFRTQQREEGFAMIEKYLDYCSSDPKAWQKAFRELMEHDDGSPEYRAFVLSMKEKMEIWQAENLGTIELEDDIMNYLQNSGA